MAKRFATLTDDQIVKAIEAVQEYRCAPERKPLLTALFTLLANLGLRVTEALSLHWKDVDWQRKEITVHTLKTGRRRNTKHAKPAEDTLPLDERTLTALAAIRKGAGPQELIFPGITRRVAYNIFQKTLHLACIRPIKLHCLRHSAVTRWIKQTKDLAFAREMARHTSLATTSQYCHCDDLREVFLRIRPLGKEAP